MAFANPSNKIDDFLALKPVKPKTEALYDYILHEWDLYASSRSGIYESGFNHE
jgi:hypothetical protein